MTIKQQRPTEEARRRLQRGRDTLANAVKVTWAPWRGGGRRAGQRVRRTQRPQGRPDGAEDGRAGEAVLAECELPARSQPTSGNQEIAQVTTPSAHGVWRRALIFLTAVERSATL